MEPQIGVRIPARQPTFRFLCRMPIVHKIILGGVLFIAIIAACVAVGLLVTTIRAVFHLNTQDIKVWSNTDVPTVMAKAAKEGWAHRSLAAFDIAFNVIVLRGQQDETISTHAWRAAQKGKLWGRVMCWWLNLFQATHGQHAACGDLERATVRVAILKKALGIQ